MFYRSAKTLAGSLGLTPKRAGQLETIFTATVDSMPHNATVSELHARLAPFLTTMEEAYYMGNLARELIIGLKQSEPTPFYAN